MGVNRQPVLTEDVVTGLHHAVIVGIDVADVYPCAHTVVLQVQSLGLEQGEVLVEEHDGLDVGAEIGNLVIRQAQAVHHKRVGLVAGLQQQADLGTADGRLLDDGAGSTVQKCHQRRLSQLVLLIGNVAEEHLGIGELSALALLCLKIVPDVIIQTGQALPKEPPSIVAYYLVLIHNLIFSFLISYLASPRISRVRRHCLSARWQTPEATPRPDRA